MIVFVLLLTLGSNNCALETIDENDISSLQYSSEGRRAELSKAPTYEDLKNDDRKEANLLVLFIIKVNEPKEKSNSNFNYNTKTRRSFDYERKKSKKSMSDDSSEYRGDRNPDNPYSTYKDKYRQNAMWNFQMSGDHMNLNPKAPSIGHMEPSPVKMFRGRKWWYFNQDDYLPMN